jgi:hypothetical protein
LGDVYRTETKITMPDNSVKFTDRGMTESGRIDMTEESVEEEEILALRDDCVTKFRIRILNGQTTVKSRVQGQSDNHTEPTPLSGETIELERVGDEWKITLVGKAPTQKQAEELKWYTPPVDAIEVYPAEPVKPGHCWSVDVKKFFRSLVGKGVELESGSWSRKFEKTTREDGELCALIKEQIELKGRARHADGQWEDVEFKVSGISLRSLERFITVSTKFEGTASSNRTLTEGGRQVQMKTTGPITIEWNTSLKQCAASNGK